MIYYVLVAEREEGRASRGMPTDRGTLTPLAPVHMDAGMYGESDGHSHGNGLRYQILDSDVLSLIYSYKTEF